MHQRRCQHVGADTVTFSSIAIVRVNITIAALAAPMTASPGVAVLTASDATLTMTPPRRLRIPGRTALVMCSEGSANWVSMKAMSPVGMFMNSSGRKSAAVVHIKMSMPDRIWSASSAGDEIHSRTEFGD